MDKETSLEVAARAAPLDALEVLTRIAMPSDRGSGDLPPHWGSSGSVGALHEGRRPGDRCTIARR